MGRLTKEELDKAYKHIRDCDSLFDGRYSPGGGFIRDREMAYNSLRVLTRELIEKLTDD